MGTPVAHVGMDFGTSNSAIAVSDGASEVDFVEFSLLGARTPSYRSLLFFDPDEQEVRLPIQFQAGVEAIEAYLEAMGEGRLVQSFKTHLTTTSLGRTQIGHHNVSLDDMLTLFFFRLRRHVEQQRKTEVRHVVLGRPVRFVGAEDDAADQKAQVRLAEAVRNGRSYDYYQELARTVATLPPDAVRKLIDQVLVADKSVTLIQGPKDGVANVLAANEITGETKLPDVVHDEYDD